MRLEDAIIHCEEKARELKDEANSHCDIPADELADCLECAKEHEQLAEWLKELKALREGKAQGDLISRSALKDAKFLTPQVKVIGGRHSGKLKEQIILAYQKGWNDCIDAIIDNAPTVEYPFYQEAYQTGYEEGKNERPQGKWIKIFENPFTNGYICPFCGHKIQVTEQFLPKVTECESCGAEMERPED